MLEYMYTNRVKGDLCIVSQEKQELKCHRDILCAQSSYFEGMFSFNQGQPPKTRIELAFEGDLLQAMLCFVYTSKVKISSSKLVDLLDMSV